MPLTNVNPVAVAKFLVYLCETEFECDHSASPSHKDKEVAYLLFEKFSKISHQYCFQEVEEYDEGGKIVQESQIHTRDDNPGESRPRDPGESVILGPRFSPGFIDGIPGLQK